MDDEIQSNLKHNYIVNVMDAGFFGAALGFASFSTVLPLFISNLTDSAVLIGLIPAIHSMGWQFPQLLTAQSTARLKHFKPVVTFFTIHERLPFFGLAFVALFLQSINHQLALWIIFLLLVWQGLGGGMTGNPWQSMIGKIIPGEIRATFFGSQSAASNLLASTCAVIAGLILQKVPFPLNFSICFFVACILMAISWVFLSRTREPIRAPQTSSLITVPFWSQVKDILRTNKTFRWFLITRMLTQFANMSFAFYTVYAVRFLGMTATTAGILTSVLLITQVVSNPILGRIADRWSRRYVLEFGAVAATLSSLIAWITPSVSWFYVVIILEGIGLVAYWTIGLAMTLEFGSESERPTYIGLANTLIAPATIIAPLIGGVVADSAGYPITFLLASIAGLITVLVLQFMVKDPQSEIIKGTPVLPDTSQN